MCISQLLEIFLHTVLEQRLTLRMLDCAWSLGVTASAPARAKLGLFPSQVRVGACLNERLPQEVIGP